MRADLRYLARQMNCERNHLLATPSKPDLLSLRNSGKRISMLLPPIAAPARISPPSKRAILPSADDIPPLGRKILPSSRNIPPYPRISPPIPYYPPRPCLVLTTSTINRYANTFSSHSITRWLITNHLRNWPPCLQFVWIPPYAAVGKPNLPRLLENEQDRRNEQAGGGAEKQVEIRQHDPRLQPHCHKTCALPPSAAHNW